MQSSTDNLVRLTFLGFLVLWILVVSAVLVQGRRPGRVRLFRDRMVAQWRLTLH